MSKDTTGLQVVQSLQQQVEGRIILITGASDGGLGAEAAISLAHAYSAHILLLARSSTKVDPVIKKIAQSTATAKTTVIPIDLDDFDSVRRAGRAVNALIEKLDILVNDAGLIAIPYFTKSKHGIEMHFATNHLGYFLLTNFIYAKIAAAGNGALIVNLTSNGYKLGPHRFDDYNFKDGEEYDPWSGYGQSKTANILFTRSLAAKLADQYILSFALHPRVILEMSIGRTSTEEMFKSISVIAMKNTGELFMVGEPKTLQQGVSTTLVAALDPQITSDSGSYLENCAIQTLRDYASSQDNA